MGSVARNLLRKAIQQRSIESQPLLSMRRSIAISNGLMAIYFLGLAILDRELAAARRAGLSDVEKVVYAPLSSFDTGACLRFPNQVRNDGVTCVSYPSLFCAEDWVSRRRCKTVPKTR